MDSTMKQLARELSDAVSAALATDARVEACREKARAAGFDMRVSLEAVVTFTSRDAAAGAKGTHARIAAPSNIDFTIRIRDHSFRGTYARPCRGNSRANLIRDEIGVVGKRRIKPAAGLASHRERGHDRL